MPVISSLKSIHFTLLLRYNQLTIIVDFRSTELCKRARDVQGSCNRSCFSRSSFVSSRLSIHKAPNISTYSTRQKNNAFSPSAKLIFITTEGGSITLRTPEEGGGNYGHHGSKAAAVGFSFPLSKHPDYIY